MQAISYAILKSRVKSHIDTHFLDNRRVVLNTQLFGAQFRKQFIDQNNKASLTRTLLNLTFEACSSKPRYRLDKSILRNKLQLKRIFHHYPVQPTVEFNTVTYRFSCYICFYSFFQCFVFLFQYLITSVQILILHLLASGLRTSLSSSLMHYLYYYYFFNVGTD